MIHFFLLAFFLIGSKEILPTMYQANTVAEIEQLTSGLGKEDLVVFDVDMVLTQPEEASFQMPNLLRHGKQYKEIMGKIAPEEKDVAVSKLVSRGPSILVDPAFLSLLEDLKRQGVKTLALSAVVTGQVAGIPSMEKWREEELKRLGIEFSTSFPEVEEFFFDQFSPYRGNFAHHKRGVILSNGEHNPVSKGELLHAFLNKVGFTPRKIVFVDDRLENLTAAEKFFRENGFAVEYIPIHYVGAKSYPSLEVDEATFKQKMEELRGEKMEYRTMEIPKKTIMGIACRTSNENVPELVAHWERFTKENILEKIPHKVGPEIYALYCEYEKDHTKPYTFLIGCEVKDFLTIPEGLVVKTIPAATYAVMNIKGEYPKSLMEAWYSIWQSKLNRTFTGDFELYGPKFMGQTNPEFEIFVAVETITKGQ